MSAPVRVARSSALAAVAVVVTASAASTVRADALALAAVPTPPGAESRVLTSNIVQEGFSTSVASIATAAPRDAALDFYRAAWPALDERDPGHLEQRLGEWSIVSRLDGDTLLVVQLRDGANGSEGFVSAMSPSAGAAVAIPPPPMPAGGELLSNVATRDAGSVARTSVVSSSARAGEVAAFYRDHLARDGWTLVSDRVHEGSPVLLLDRRGARLEVVVSDVDGRSVAVVNEVRLDD